MAITFTDRKSANEHALVLKEQGIGTKVIKTRGGKLQVVRTGVVSTVGRGVAKETGALVLAAEPTKVAAPIVRSVSKKIHPFLKSKRNYRTTVGGEGKHPRIGLGIPINFELKVMPGSIGTGRGRKNIGRIKTVQKDIADVNIKTREL